MSCRFSLSLQHTPVTSTDDLRRASPEDAASVAARSWLAVGAASAPRRSYRSLTTRCGAELTVGRAAWGNGKVSSSPVAAEAAAEADAASTKLLAAAAEGTVPPWDVRRVCLGWRDDVDGKALADAARRSGLGGINEQVRLELQRLLSWCAGGAGGVVSRVRDASGCSAPSVCSCRRSVELMSRRMSSSARPATWPSASPPALTASSSANSAKACGGTI